MEDEIPEVPYARFMRPNGIPYAYVKLTLEEYLDTEVPIEAKWGSTTDGTLDENGDLVRYARPLSEFAPHVMIDEEHKEVFMLLCACSKPSVRQNPVTPADLDEWDAYLNAVFSIDSSKWLTFDEANGLFNGKAL